MHTRIEKLFASGIPDAARCLDMGERILGYGRAKPWIK